jgi:hypothetical protein
VKAFALLRVMISPTPTNRIQLLLHYVLHSVKKRQMITSSQTQQGPPPAQRSAHVGAIEESMLSYYSNDQAVRDNLMSVHVYRV